MKNLGKKIIFPVIVAGCVVAGGGIGYLVKQSGGFSTAENTTSDNKTASDGTSDGTVTFTLYDEDGNEDKVETTWEEIESDEEIKTKWEEYKEKISAPSSNENVETQQDEETSSRAATSEDMVSPAIDYEEYVKNKKEYSDEENSISAEKCEKLLKKAKPYYEDMQNKKRNTDTFFVKAYEALKEKYTESRYYDLKANLSALTGED